MVDEIETFEAERAGELHVADDVRRLCSLQHHLRRFDVAADHHLARLGERFGNAEANRQIVIDEEKRTVAHTTSRSLVSRTSLLYGLRRKPTCFDDHCGRRASSA